MKVNVDRAFCKAYPNAVIGYVIASFDPERFDNVFLEAKVSGLHQKMLEHGFEPGVSIKEDPRIKIWRDIYTDMGVKPNDYPSSVESLCRRALNNKFPRILPMIDFYNACSVEALLPMGGYDLDKIEGDISLEYASEGDRFRGLGSAGDQPVDPRHLVYKDDKQVICWLWNHKDAADTAIDANTRRAIFFVDCPDYELEGLVPVLEIMATFQKHLAAFGSCASIGGVLTREISSATIDLNVLEELVGPMP